MKEAFLPEIKSSIEDDDFFSKPFEPKKASVRRSHSLTRQSSDEVIKIATSNPSHLFWVPASQHPEIAPTEFEKFVQAQGLIVRKKSNKRKSVLSLSFTPQDYQKTLRKSISLQDIDYTRNGLDLLIFDRHSSPHDQSKALIPRVDRPLSRRGAVNRNATIKNKEVGEELVELEIVEPEAVVTVVDPEEVISDVIAEEPLVLTRSVSTSTMSNSQNNAWPTMTINKKPTKKKFTLSSIFGSIRKTKSSQQISSNQIQEITNHLNETIQPTISFRLPLHVERAVYRLSHMKLANPKRPLHQQVLISNHMFWYLSIISDHPQPTKKHLPRKRMPKNKPLIEQIHSKQQQQQQQDQDDDLVPLVTFKK